VKKTGVLIDAGRLRVDRQRALNKLMRFQLPNARMYPLPWIRAAVLCGATGIDITSTPAGFEMSWDGRAFDPADLKDPYHHLFEDTEGAALRVRELAIGILAAMRLKPKHVSFTFRWGNREYVLRIDSLTSENLVVKNPLKKIPAGNPRSSIWVGLIGGHRQELAFLKKFAAHCPIPIRYRGKSLISSLGKSPAVLKQPFKAPGLNGELRIDRQSLGACSIDLVRLGVIVETQELRLPGIQASGYVACNSLRTSLSQSGVIYDDNYHAAIAALGQASVALLAAATKESHQLATKAMRAIKNRGLHSRWIPWAAVGFSESLQRVLDSAGPPKNASEQSIERMSVLTALLRQACIMHRQDMIRNQGVAAKALWNAIVIYDSKGTPLTLRQLEIQERWLHQIPYVQGHHPVAVDTLIAAWIIRKSDLDFLTAFFPSKTQYHRENPTGTLPHHKPVIRERNMLVRRAFQAGLICGELGLSLTPRRTMARFLWVNDKRVLGRSRWNLGGLRLDAAIYHPQLTMVPATNTESPITAQCSSAVMQSVDKLYFKLATDYDADKDTPIQIIRREHLLDLVGTTYDRGVRRCPRHPWLEGKRLFRTPKGRMLSLTEIRNATSVGKTILLARSPHPPKFALLANGYPNHLRRIFSGDKLVVIAQEKKKPATKRPPKTPSKSKKLPSQASSPTPTKLRIQEPRPAPATTIDLVKDPGQEAMRWLRELKNRGGFELPPGKSRIRMGQRSSKRFVLRDTDRSWLINRNSTLYKVFERQGGPIHALPYFVSAFYSGVNHYRNDISDAEDIRFQLALLRLALERYE
jgi:hypothetical protein